MNSLCTHFGECGGCSYQDIPYQEQLNNKEQKIKDFAQACDIACEIKPFNSFAQWHYRNKMEFTFGGTIAIACGLYKKESRREVFNMQECRIFSPDTKPILDAIRGFIAKNNYTTYNKYAYKGFLRNLIVRQTKFTGQTMVGLVTTSQAPQDKDGLVKALTTLSIDSPVSSVYWITNDSWSDFIVFEKKELIYGEPFIEEELDGFRFAIGIDSFFQVNSSGIKVLYDKIRSYAELTGKEKIMDLFCGAGGIGMFLARKAGSVLGIELQQQIVEAAIQNAARNNIENISFVTADVRKFLNCENQSRDIDMVVINPPRPGISHKIKRAIMRLEPKTMFYSSCNPETLCRDLKDLSSQYKPLFLEPFDFFPHTKHVECLAKLVRIT